jgi:hypothetical protein
MYDDKSSCDKKCHNYGRVTVFGTFSGLIVIKLLFSRNVNLLEIICFKCRDLRKI